MNKVEGQLLLLAICCFLSTGSGCHKSAAIDFYRERIVIEIGNMEARVSGEYFFKNNTATSKQIKFYYPFPVDSIHDYPNIIVLDYAYEKDSSGLYFVLGMEARESSSFKITYNQPVKKENFRYITTTTKTWHKPIKQAEFTIIAPQELALKINYKISKKYRQSNWEYYYIKCNYFFPNEDLFIEW